MIAIGQGKGVSMCLGSIWELQRRLKAISELPRPKRRIAAKENGDCDRDTSQDWQQTWEATVYRPFLNQSDVADKNSIGLDRQPRYNSASWGDYAGLAG